MLSASLQKKAIKAYNNNAVNKSRNAATLPAVPVFQGKPIQKMEEEEPVQSKLTTQLKADNGIAQLQEPEEEPVQGKFALASNGSVNVSPAQPKFVLQKKANNTGLPDNLKAGVESLSGFAMDDVKVHYNSAKPAQLQALAYAQGTDIHLAPGQEKHLPHEAWHVAQQKQGRVQPTMQMKEGIAVNDDAGLENEADVMGTKAQTATQSVSTTNSTQLRMNTAQLFTGTKPFQLLRGTTVNKPYLDAALQKDIFKNDVDHVKLCFKNATSIGQFERETADQTAFNTWKRANGIAVAESATPEPSSTPSTPTPSPTPPTPVTPSATPVTSTPTPAPTTPGVLGVAKNVSDLNAKETEYKAHPALYAESILAAGGNIGDYFVASMATKVNTVNVDLRKGKHTAVVHYHPDPADTNDVHAKLKHSSLHKELLTDTKLGEMGLEVRGTVRGWKWTKDRSSGRWTR